MADLISRAAAIAEVEEYLQELDSCISEPDLKLDGYRNGLQVAIQELKALHAVDAVPVAHGRWVEVPGYVTPGGDPVWKCSECGKGVHVYGIEHGTYGAEVADGQWVSCPNCGAIIDGERRDGE